MVMGGARWRDNRWPSRVTDWIPREGKRVRRREKVCWADEIKTFAGTTCQESSTGVRIEWRNMGNAFALQWA